MYGGCGGSANYFVTFKQCVEACPEEPCLQPMEQGTCVGFLERFFYNRLTEQCEPFYYGGCDGNRNNFESLRACEAVCKVRKTLCRQEKKVGTCTVFQPRIWYNGPIHRCESFRYSGCQKNANNFESVEECKRMCMPFDTS